MKFSLVGIVLFFCFLGVPVDNYAQDVSIFNRGLEDTPRRGTTAGFNYTRSVDGWYDCGTRKFPGESPPDIHPNNFWKNNLKPQAGKSYVGLVVRQNDTWESISQKLDVPLKKDQCYEFTVYLARSDNYWSGSKDINNKVIRDEVNYVTPSVFRLWGGKGSFCNQTQLIAESEPVAHSNWKQYTFKIEPTTDLDVITIEAFYVTPVWFPYNGHILLDELSDFTEIPCDDELPVEVAEVDVPVKVDDEKEEPVIKLPAETTTTPAQEVVTYEKPKILVELRNPERLKKGQTIRIKNLYFQADTSSISKSSYSVLEELGNFLKFNRNFVIEVGGHTNNVPTDAYCDSLSEERAMKVFTYLIDMGAKEEQVVYKGYGKRKPIASNETPVGRARNQRVEIKIISK